MKTFMKNLSTKQDVNEFLAKHDTFLLDCDGVLWHGAHAFPGVPETLDYLRKLGKRVLFVTNNSTLSSDQYLVKFTKMGIHAIEDEIFGSSRATAFYLSKILKFPADKRVYVIGQDGIYNELEKQGISCLGRQDEDSIDWQELPSLQLDPTIGAVVVGFDMNINYRKLAKAYTYLHSNPDCLFIATNTDTAYPFGGRTFPGTGTFVAAVAACTKRTPLIMGKPHSTMMDCIIAKLHLDPSKTCMVGDRLDTDIKFGQHAGMSTLLVMSGVTKEHDLKESMVHPEFIVDKFSTLFQE